MNYKGQVRYKDGSEITVTDNNSIYESLEEFKAVFEVQFCEEEPIKFVKVEESKKPYIVTAKGKGPNRSYKVEQ